MFHTFKLCLMTTTLLPFLFEILLKRYGVVFFTKALVVLMTNEFPHILNGSEIVTVINKERAKSLIFMKLIIERSLVSGH